MAALLKRTEVQARISATFASPDAIQPVVADATLPDNLTNWLTRLMLLYGVPFNSLVPDEGMLPPESIRFFYLDMSWIDALIDGAFSIGRNLTTSNNGASMNLDRAVHAQVRGQIRANLPSIRAKLLGIATPVISPQVITGFLLRSSLVTAYPGIGVLAYEAGSTTPMNPLRFEPLGPQSDTIICLFPGDAAQVSIHEPPEALHYGIDTYSASGTTIQAGKTIYTFTQSGSQVTMTGATASLDLSNSFRSGSPRCIMLATVAGQIATANNVNTIDSAEMGFEMTEGVGMVTFQKATS